jgi:FemAB-related protein (PEP-CTERM system-associated)
MAPMKFHWLNIDEGEALWDQALTRFPGIYFSFLYGWRKVYENALKLKTHYLLVEEDGQVTGLCPLIYMKSPWLGRGTFLISLPYMTRAGICALDQKIRETMINRLIDKARELKAGFIELRELTSDRFSASFPSNKEHVQMVLELPEDWARYEKEIAPRLRQVKKAQKAGLNIRTGKGKDLLSDFYRVFSQRMRELFFPVYPKNYFRMILEVFEAQTRLAVVYDREKPLGGMLLFKHGDTCSVPYVATLVEHQTSHPNQLLYYGAIRQAWEEGYRNFDFCRSQVHSGTFTFKSQWKAKPQGLTYLYPLSKGERPVPSVGQAQKSTAFLLAEKIWPRLPLPVTQWLGGKLIRQLVLA